MKIKWNFDLNCLFLVELGESSMLARVESDERFRQQKRYDYYFVLALDDWDATIAIVSDLLQCLVCKLLVKRKHKVDSCDLSHNLFTWLLLECNGSFNHLCLVVGQSIDAVWKVVTDLFEGVD